jgi:hypothetical protein
MPVESLDSGGAYECRGFKAVHMESLQNAEWPAHKRIASDCTLHISEGVLLCSSLGVKGSVKAVEDPSGLEQTYV